MSLEAEQAVIGLSLRSADAWRAAAASGLSPQHFTDPTCQALWVAMLAADAKVGRVTVLSLWEVASQELMRQLNSFLPHTPMAQNVLAYADNVLASYWQQQALLSIAELTAHLKAWQEWQPIEQFRQRFAETMARLSTLTTGEKSKPALAADLLPAVIDEIEAMFAAADGEKKSTGIPTGFQSLDIVLNSGWQRGQMYTVAARPGGGKTTFSLSTAIEAAMRGHKVLYGTVEMSARDIVKKLLSNRAKVVGGKYQSGDLTAQDIDQTHHGIKEIVPMRLWIDDLWRGQIETLFHNAGRIRRSDGLDMVVVDYVGLAKIEGKHDSSKERFSAISKFCKAAALEMNVAVLLLSQLNRDAEKFDRPSLTHLSTADEISHDSDAVLILYKFQDKKSSGDPESRIALVKNRWGKTIDIPVQADLARNAYRSVDLNWESFRDG
jgi:replicative DNA helicase